MQRRVPDTTRARELVGFEPTRRPRRDHRTSSTISVTGPNDAGAPGNRRYLARRGRRPVFAAAFLPLARRSVSPRSAPARDAASRPRRTRRPQEPRQAVPYLGGVAIVLPSPSPCSRRRSSTDRPAGSVSSPHPGARPSAGPRGAARRPSRARRARTPGASGSAGVTVWAAGAAGPTFSAHRAVDCCVTVLWVVGITNAFNLLDNMDGLSAGVAAIAAGAFFVIAAAQRAVPRGCARRRPGRLRPRVPAPQLPPGADLHGRRRQPLPRVPARRPRLSSLRRPAEVTFFVPSSCSGCRSSTPRSLPSPG